jgi:hypothetical protein
MTAEQLQRILYALSETLTEFRFLLFQEGSPDAHLYLRPFDLDHFSHNAPMENAL